MKRNHKIIITAIAAIVIGIVIGAVVISSYISKFDKQISSISISNVDISKVPNGTYTGSYKVYPVNVIVEVTVNDHKITEINLVKHENGKGAAAEIITDKVVEAQSLEVDTVTGATVSSKVILKAIEDALNSSVK